MVAARAGGMHASQQRHKVAIIDFGSQYTQLIARRVRELGVYSEIFPYTADAGTLRDFSARCVILSGGPESVTEDEAPQPACDIAALKAPVLGICYGMQWMASRFGGEVEAAGHREFGHADIEITGPTRLFGAGAGARLQTWMSHGDRVVALPPGFSGVARSRGSPIAAMADEERGFYGLQFHPEVTHTSNGREILRRFVCEIGGCQPQWRPGSIIEDSIRSIRERVGDEQVVLGLSGGVDSSVAALLIHRAIGDQLHCVFVDNGLLRLGEREQVHDTFARHFGMDLHTVPAAGIFLKALEGVVDPERKRRVIGGLFVDMFEEKARSLGDVRWLAQGTIYPDVIESASAGREGARLIKSHHNVGGLPAKMRLKLLEPLAGLFKDEVRKIGFELGLEREVLDRHPFPGPGLAVRVIGEVRGEALELLRRADFIFMEELKNGGFYDRVAQAFAVMLPVKSVSVMGDGRHYGFVVVLRAVETDDFMTARYARLPPDFIEGVSRRIVNEVPGISRVCYDVSSKPPATIEWE